MGGVTLPHEEIPLTLQCLIDGNSPAQHALGRISTRPKLLTIAAIRRKATDSSRWILNGRAASAAVLSPLEPILLISVCCGGEGFGGARRYVLHAGLNPIRLVIRAAGRVRTQRKSPPSA